MSAGFLDAFLRRAAREPKAAAIVLYAGGTPVALTNGALRVAALRWATLFRVRGARPGDVVLLSLPVGYDVIAGFLGALCAGCVPSFMPFPSAKQDPALFWSSHNRLFARLGGGLILTTAENGEAVATHVRDAAMTLVTPADLADVPMHDDVPSHPWRADDIGVPSAFLWNDRPQEGCGVELRGDRRAARGLRARARHRRARHDRVLVAALP